MRAVYSGDDGSTATSTGADGGGGGGGGGGDDDDDDGENGGGPASERERAKAAAVRATATARASRIELRLRRALDPSRRQRMLASIYIMRSDTQPQVCEAASTAWKALVTNTPATLSEVLPAMLDVIVANVASGSEERRDVAGRTLATLVKKLGDRILPPLLTSIRTQVWKKICFACVKRRTF